MLHICMCGWVGACVCMCAPVPAAYITEDFVVPAGSDVVLLFRVACPLVQIGPVQHSTQHILALLCHHVGDDVSWEVVLCLGLVVGLLIVSL